jgi:hypothetical protein
MTASRARLTRLLIVPRERPQDTHTDGDRHLLTLLACHRSTVQLSRRGRCCHARSCVRQDRLSEDDPGRPGLRVHLPGSRPLGLHERRDAGLLQAGKPTDNAFIEAFNGRLRAECLSANWFMSLSDAREKLECWRGDYNTVRPHSAIGNKPRQR